jgi:hypothetical protein
VTKRARYLRKADIAHIVRAATGVTGRDTFVIVGTGAVIAQLRTVPLDLMETREIDIYVPDTPDGDSFSDLIDGSIGEGSPFDEAFGYYAHGVGPLTACLPDDWGARAVRYELPNLPGVVCLCPEANDIALSKLCAWRDKDRAWISAGLGAGVLRLDAMRARSGLISNPNAPDGAEIERRLATLGRVDDG